MSDTALMHIGELARKAGVSTRTLRFYEQQGLLVPAVRTERGVGIYAREQVRKLRLIQLFKSLGISLGQIKDYLSMAESDVTGGEIAEQIRKLVEAQMKRLDAKIRQYEEARAEMKQAYDFFEDCLSCTRKLSEGDCPCEFLRENREKLPIMVELLG